jgi:hypothetical protein
MRFALPALAVLVLLAGCAPESGPKLHDVTVYGALNARLSYLYGSPRKFDLDGKQVTLSQGTSTAAYAVDSALLVDGQPFVRTSVTPLQAAPIVVSRIPLTTDLRLEARSDVEQVVYFDGSDYFQLVSGAKAGTSQTVVPTPRLNRLRGLGELTDGEADALANGLEQGGKPYVLAVLPSTTLPKHSVNGTSEYLQTGVYVQQGLETGAAAPGSTAQQVAWETLAQGQKAVGFDKPQYLLVNSQDQLTNLWYKAYGSQLTVPPVPSIDFSRETVIAVFDGQKPTGGYGLQVRSVTVENGELYVDLVKQQPQQGQVTTQSLTSPWLLIHVLRGGFDVAWFRNPDDGSLIAVARATQ